MPRKSKTKMMHQHHNTVPWLFTSMRAVEGFTDRSRTPVRTAMESPLVVLGLKTVFGGRRRE